MKDYTVYTLISGQWVATELPIEAKSRRAACKIYRCAAGEKAQVWKIRLVGANQS